MTEVGPVESDIPIPERKKPDPHDKLRLSQFKVGQSRLIKGMPQHRLSAKAALAHRNHGMRFVTRVMDGGVRIWRIA